MFDLALVNGYIVDTDRIYKGNLYVSGEKIAAIVEKALFDAKEVVDVSGMLLFPGGIDTHMHIGEYKADFEEMDTSTAAAVVGGMTCLLDMPLNLMTPSVVNVDIFKEKKEHLLEKSYADFCMYAELVQSNIKQLEKLHNEGAIAFKSFLPGAGSDFFAPEMTDIRRALQTIASFDGIAAFHCEDNSIIHSELEDMKKNKKNTRQAFLDSRPLCAETIAVRDVIELSESEHAKIHICHVSHPKVAKIIEQAKARNIDVSAETCIHYLTFTEKDLISNTTSNVSCTPNITKGSIIEVGISDFTIEVKYNGTDSLTESIEDVCEIKYDFIPLDTTPPVLTAETISQENKTARLKITATDEDGGSGLSPDNIYKFCLSTSDEEAKECTWTNYISGEEFEVTAPSNGEYYLLVYSIGDKAGNISDGKENIGEIVNKLYVPLFNKVQDFAYT